MGFDIEFNFRKLSADRNEALAASLLDLFPTLQRFPLNYDVIANSLGIPCDELRSKWCQIELHDKGGELAGAIITFFPESINIEVTSSPSAGCAATLAILSPLFEAIKNAGGEINPSLDLLAEYEMQRSLVERVVQIVRKGGWSGVAFLLSPAVRDVTSVRNGLSVH